MHNAHQSYEEEPHLIQRYGISSRTLVRTKQMVEYLPNKNRLELQLNY